MPKTELDMPTRQGQIQIRRVRFAMIESSTVFPEGRCTTVFIVLRLMPGPTLL